MCLILFSYGRPAGYRLVLAANRDEFYNRPSQPMGFWKKKPHVLAGRDLQGGGTWMGVTRQGRMAAITNYRDPSSWMQNAPSRGRLVSNYLTGNQHPRAYLESLEASSSGFNGYNLLTGDRNGLFYYSNRSSGIREISPGLYGLSNHLLDTPWPKIQLGKTRLRRLLENDRRPDPEAIFQMLSDRTVPEDRYLPDTGIGLQWERILSPLMITAEGYGTRCSTVVLWDRSGNIEVWERTYLHNGPEPLTAETRHFAFQVDCP